MQFFQKIFRVALVFGVLFVLPTYSWAAAGDLDPTFGTGGIVTTNFPGTADANRDAAVQPDGKIVVLGLGRGPDNLPDCGLARYRLNGSLDATFGSNGLVTSLFDINASAVSLQPDGKILVGGNLDGNFAVARFNYDGSHDTTFGNGGLVTLDFFSPATADEVWHLAVQTDGKIVAVGEAQQTNWMAFARFNPNGSVDSTFGNGGRITPGIGPGLEQALAGALQPDGKIVAVGAAYNGEPAKNDFAIMRLNINGQLDPSFDNDGRILTDFDNNYDGAMDVVIQPDGKIVVAGSAGHALGDRFGLVRYNENGSLDATFSNGGKVTTRFLDRVSSATSLVLQSDGRIIVGGRISDSGAALARYNADGSLDLSFGNQGLATNHLSARADAVVLQPDGKVIVVGLSGFVARYLTAQTNAPVLQTETTSNRALALDSVTLLRDPFSVTNQHNFSVDQRTRVILFATLLTLSSGEGLSAVSVQAQAAGGGVHTLPVEYVGEVPGLEWLTQVVFKLPDGLANAGDVQVTVRLRGEVSNQGFISIE